jgi:hypothetical protein
MKPPLAGVTAVWAAPGRKVKDVNDRAADMLLPCEKH